MPYRKRGYRSRSRRIRRRRKTSSVTRLARRVTFNRPEIRYLRGNYGTPGTGVTLVHANPLQYLLNGLTLGTSAARRIGDKARFKFLELRTTINRNDAVAGNSYNAAVRMVVFLQRLPGGVADAPFGAATPYVDGTFDLQTQAFKRRFVILRDHTFNLSAGARSTKNIITKIPLRFSTDYSLGNAGDITDIDSNALYFMLMTDATTGAYLTTWSHFQISYHS